MSAARGLGAFFDRPPFTLLKIRVETLKPRWAYRPSVRETASGLALGPFLFAH